MFVFLITGIVLSTPVDPNISNTREASCVVQITIDYSVMHLEYDTIESLIKSSGVLGKASREILESTPDKTGVAIGSQAPRGLINDPFTFKLMVSLQEDAKPAANEFLKALIKNLQSNLDNAFSTYREKFNIQYGIAEHNYKLAESELNKLNEEPTIKIIPNENYRPDYATNEKLKKVVNLSQLQPDMSLAEVLEIMEKSVDPPLQIQTNWRDLAEMADILPTTPAEMSPFKSIKLGKALDVLMESQSSNGEIGYIVDDGVITIATKDSLNLRMATVLYEISGLLVNGRASNSIVNAIKETIEPDSWYDENISIVTPSPSGGYGITSQVYTGEGKIVDMQGGKISVYNTPEIQDKIASFLANFPKEISTESIESIPVDILNKDKQDLGRQRRSLELEIARLEARKSAAEQQIVGFNSKMQNKASFMVLQQNLAELVSKLAALKSTRGEQHSEVVAVQKQIDEIQKQIKSSQQDTVTSELERLIENQTQQLNSLKKQFAELLASQLVAPGPSKEITEAEEKLARTKIELAKRREELARPAGIGNLEALNENLSMALLDLAEKKAEFQVLEKQLSEIESQIRAASTTDPKILKIRQTKKAFEEAEKRLNELEQVKSNLQPPQVIAIGLN